MASGRKVNTFFTTVFDGSLISLTYTDRGVKDSGVVSLGIRDAVRERGNYPRGQQAQAVLSKSEALRLIRELARRIEEEV